MARADRYSDGQKEVIAKVQTKKNVRRKKIKRENARLRDRGEKFSHKDVCYKA